MSINTLNAKLEAINDKCENTIKLKLHKFHTDIHYDNLEFHTPSPQVIEALWFDLITEKEHEFVKEIALALNIPNTTLSKENALSIEKTINDVFADDQYLERMRDFYKEFYEKDVLNGMLIDSTTNRLDLIDSAYQEGLIKILCKARGHVLAELELHKKNEPEELGIFAQWRKYSTLSPLRAISTIVLLYCTSLLIAWIIKGETFQQFLERFGWSAGSGL